MYQTTIEARKSPAGFGCGRAMFGHLWDPLSKLIHGGRIKTKMLQ
jgi:hypothetical protein